MKVLIGCECSGIERDAFIARGHDAISCDLKPTERPGPHYQGDVFDLDWCAFDLAIFHPVCTKICNSGSKHLYIDGRHENGYNKQRWREMYEGAEFFKRCMAWDAPMVACENPVMLSYAQEYIGEDNWDLKYFIQPWQFGHPESKKTMLMTRGLPKLKPTNDVYDYMMTLPVKERNRIHHMAPGKDRGAKRSEAYPGIADAFADQWGSLPVLTR